MECIKLTLYATGLTIVFMLFCTLCAIFAPVIVLYLVLTGWQDIDADEAEDEMHNAR